MDPYVIVDVGARWGVADRWRSLAPDVEIIGFDPDPEECERLGRLAHEEGTTFVRYVPHALGAAETTVTLYDTAEPACSSIYAPIPALADTFVELRCTAEVSRQTITLTTLDAWCATNGTTHVDFLKLDVQGAELDVLRGATTTLSTVQLLEIEVEFNPIYAGQPLFGDVDAFLRNRGFVLWRLDHLVHYSTAPSEPGQETIAYYDSVPVVSPRPGGQVYWGHATYARSRLCPGSGSSEPPTTPGERLRTAQLAEVAGLGDLAAALRAST